VVRDRLELALETLEEAHVNTIHGFCAELLRERPVEACVDPLFAVLTEPQADRVYGRAFRAWLQEALRNPPEGMRRALRRTSVFGGLPATDGGGPVDRLRGAGRMLADWRVFPHPWKRPPFDREATMDRLVAALHGFADLTAAASSTGDNLYRHRRGASAQPSDPARAVLRAARSRRLGSAARRPDPRPWLFAATQGGSCKFGRT
jgi:hypothetical protein